ncbi:hypothetical protein BpHYR1_036196 [Brachionus plicatilis]|uniref:Uncharacterized protein n=1 Tax=Brachionus plicatilis TaxID=10195 RepID=A0A3M7RK09_BRAPC|nr:hypothetical protein BpHYR1_036196 [Brachionus plicatilis]
MNFEREISIFCKQFKTKNIVTNQRKFMCFFNTNKFFLVSLDQLADLELLDSMVNIPDFTRINRMILSEADAEMAVKEFEKF